LPKPNIPVDVCQKDNLFSAALYDTRNLPSGENAHAQIAAVCALMVCGKIYLKIVNPQ